MNAPRVKTDGVWQPIETAPKDGTWFLIARFDEDQSGFEIGKYAPHFWPEYEDAGNGLFRKIDRQTGEWDGFSNFHRATHWHTLPEPPSDVSRSLRKAGGE